MDADRACRRFRAEPERPAVHGRPRRARRSVPAARRRAGAGTSARCPRRSSAVSSDSASWLGSSGEKAGSPASEASVLCIWAVADAERLQALQEHLGLGGHLLQRQRPTVDRVGDELLGHAQRPGQGGSLVLVPAVQRRDIGEAVRGQEPQQLQLRIDPRLDLAKHFEHVAIAEHERGVRLLHADRAHRYVVGHRHPFVDAAEAERSLVGGQIAALLDSAQQLAGVHRLGQRVVGDELVGSADLILGRRHVLILAVGHAQRQLVELVRARGQSVPGPARSPASGPGAAPLPRRCRFPPPAASWRHTSVAG